MPYYKDLWTCYTCNSYNLVSQKGYDVLKVLEREVHTQGLYSFKCPKFIIHSANPVGRANMEACIASIHKFLEAKN